MAHVKLSFHGSSTLVKLKIIIILTILSISPLFQEVDSSFPFSSFADITDMLNFQNTEASEKSTKECYKQFTESSFTHPDTNLRIDEIIAKYGYYGETRKVTTKDGYILTLYRIIGSPSSPPDTNKPPVFLNHGLFASGHIWLLQHGTRNLAFKLAQAGFDVWIGNARGTQDSQEHVRLHSNHTNYWDFTWHEMAIYDLPRVIEEIRNETKHSKILYLGHSMACTEYFVAMSELPYLNEYIQLAILYAPVAYINNSRVFSKKLAPKANDLRKKLDQVLQGKIDIRTLVQEEILGISMSDICSYRIFACSVCEGIYDLLFGSNPKQTNYTLLPYILSLFPQPASLKTITHYAQLMTSGRFCNFDYNDEELNRATYGSATPPEYNLNKITAPTVLFWSENDIIAVPEDVKRTMAKLSRKALKNIIRIPMAEWRHSDFIKAIDADKYVYDRTIDLFKDAWKSRG